MKLAERDDLSLRACLWLYLAGLGLICWTLMFELDSFWPGQPDGCPVSRCTGESSPGQSHNPGCVHMRAVHLIAQPAALSELCSCLSSQASWAVHHQLARELGQKVPDTCRQTWPHEQAQGRDLKRNHARVHGPLWSWGRLTDEA